MREFNVPKVKGILCEKFCAFVNYNLQIWVQSTDPRYIAME